MQGVACDDMRVMKKYTAIFLSLLIVGAPLYAADDAEPAKPSAADTRYDKKEAMNWFKTTLKNKQATVKILKKVKDQKSLDKAGKELQKLYGTKGKATAMGEAGPATKPAGAAELEEKNAAKLEKLDEAINAQIERIQGLELDTAEFDKGIEAMNSAVSGE